MEQWRAVLNAVMKYWVPKQPNKQRNWATTNFWWGL